MSVKTTFAFVNQHRASAKGFPFSSGEFFGGYTNQKSSLQQLIGRLWCIVIGPLHRILVGTSRADHLAWSLCKAGLIHRADVGQVDDAAIQRHKVYSKSHGVGPSRNVVKQAVLESSARFKHRLDQAVLRLVGRDDVGVSFFELLAIDDQVFLEGKEFDVVLENQVCQVVAPRILFFGPKDVGLVDVCIGFLFDVVVEILHPLVEFHTHLFGGLVGGKVGGKLVADRKRKAEHAIVRFLEMPSGASLLKQDADRSLYIRIGRPFAVVEVVVVFLIVVQGADFIQGLRMVGTDFLGQLEILGWRKWMHP